MDENIEVKDIFFQSGLKYTSCIYYNGNLVKLSRYFSNGNLSELHEFSEGKLTTKKIYNRSGEVLETISYTYYDTGDIAAISKETINSASSATFIRDELKRIINIRIRRNSTIIRKIDYEYTAKGIQCYEFNQSGEQEYTLINPPKADESWLKIQTPNSLVMRKFLVTIAATA